MHPLLPNHPSLPRTSTHSRYTSETSLPTQDCARTAFPDEAFSSRESPRPSRRELPAKKSSAFAQPLLSSSHMDTCPTTADDITVGVQTEEQILSDEEAGVAGYDSDLVSHVSDAPHAAPADEEMAAYSRAPVPAQLIPAPPAGKEKAKELKDNPRKGMIYYLIHTVLLSGNMYAAQQLFREAGAASTMQLTFIRGAVCSLMMLLMVNRSAKSTLVDPVDRKTLPGLVFRCLQSGVSVYISFMSVKYFNVSTVGIVCSLKPIIACLLSVLLLSERMGWKDVLSMSAIFVAVLLVILGSGGDQQEHMQSNPWAMVALISQPLLLAGGDIAMRRMRKMPEQLCSTYQNLSLSLIFGAALVLTGEGFEFIAALSLKAWLYLTLSCSLTILTQLAKFNAFKFCEAQPLQKLSFLPNVWQFGVDLLILSVVFTKMQFLGFALLIAFYVIELTYNMVESRLARRKLTTDDEGYARI